MEFPTDASSFADDKAKCDKKLGHEPPPPPESGISISEGVMERIQSGSVDEERITNYDNYWMDKLACIDEAHTARNGLYAEAAEKILRDLSVYARPTGEKSCPTERKKLIECYKRNRGQALNCNAEVENFVSCVDKLLSDGARADCATITVNEKPTTYAERFQRES